MPRPRKYVGPSPGLGKGGGHLDTVQSKAEQKYVGSICSPTAPGVIGLSSTEPLARSGAFDSGLGQGSGFTTLPTGHEADPMQMGSIDQAGGLDSDKYSVSIAWQPDTQPDNKPNFASISSQLSEICPSFIYPKSILWSR